MDQPHPQNSPAGLSTASPHPEPVSGQAPLQHHHPVDNRTELEKIVTRSVGDLQQNWDTYGSKVVLYISLGLLLVAAIIYWTRTKDNYQQAAWTQLNSAGSAVDFENVAEEFSKLPAGQWAALQAADAHLNLATQLMFQDRKSSEAELKQAQTGYNSILSANDFPVEIRQRAQFGLARTLESTSNGELEPAIKAYEAAISMAPESVTAGLANKRIEELKLPGAKEFYVWFSQQNPEPDDRAEPQDGQPTTSESLTPNVPMFGDALSQPLSSKDVPLSQPENSVDVPTLTAPADPAFSNPAPVMKDETAPLTSPEASTTISTPEPTALVPESTSSGDATTPADAASKPE